MDKDRHSLRRALFTGLVLHSWALHGAVAPDTRAERKVVEWQPWPAAKVQMHGAAANTGTNGWLEVKTRKEPGRVGLKVKMAPDCRNLAAFAEIAVPVCNRGTNNLRLILRVDDDSTESLPTVQTRKCIFQVLISPDPEPMWLVVPLGDKKPSLA